MDNRVKTLKNISKMKLLRPATSGAYMGISRIKARLDHYLRKNRLGGTIDQAKDVIDELAELEAAVSHHAHLAEESKDQQNQVRCRVYLKEIKRLYGQVVIRETPQAQGGNARALSFLAVKIHVIARAKPLYAEHKNMSHVAHLIENRMNSDAQAFGIDTVRPSYNTIYEWVRAARTSGEIDAE